MTDAKSLRESIGQYEFQLAQVNTTLSSTPDGPDRDNLLSLKSDIEELISLMRESLQNLEENSVKDKDGDEKEKEDKVQDPLDKEYALFKAELESSSRSSDNENTKPDDTSATVCGNMEEELKNLEGKMCKAPYSNTWGGIGYHNAMVCTVYGNDVDEVSDISDIKVRVLFLNPMHKKMIPCPYFLNGNCKFTHESCHYSHGEVVSFSSLQEYKEPDFRTIKVGSRVLAKRKNNIWHRSIVLKLPEKNEDEYRVKFESSGEIMETNLQDLLPLNDAGIGISQTSDESDEDDFVPNSSSCSNDQLIHKSLLTLQPNEPLGNWERHTRGIGSKLMMQMGYVVGTGLGKRGDGRIQPVEATILPAGKSLDHCMALREFAGLDKDLFSAERVMRKQQQKLEHRREKQYQREKEREDNNVFNFINKILGDKPKNDNAAGSSGGKHKLKTISNYNLKITKTAN